MEGRSLEGMYMFFPLLRHAAELTVSCISFGFVLVREIFGLENDSPSCGEDIAVEAELI